MSAPPRPRTTIIAAARTAPPARRAPVPAPPPHMPLWPEAATRPAAVATELPAPPVVTGARTAPAVSTGGTPPVVAPRRAPGPRPSALRVVWWQLALIPALLAIGRPWPLAAALGTASVALLAITAGRTRGTWLSTVAGRRTGMLVRRTRVTAAPGTTCTDAVLRHLAPGATVDATGAVNRPQGTSAVLVPVRAGAAEVLRMALSHPDAGTHVLLHRGSRDEHPRAWLTVRVERTVDALDDGVLTVSLTNATRRLLRRARQAGLDLRVLNGDEVRSTVGALARAGSGRITFHETWRHWKAGDLTQVGLRLRGAQARIATIERLLTGSPGVSVTITVAADVPHLDGCVRVVAADPAAVDAAVDRLTALGQMLDVRLERLDGRHCRAVAATLPIGGDLP
jgi:hypothetical protein